MGFNINGVLTPSGYIHPLAPALSARFLIHAGMPAAAAGGGLSLPTNVETHVPISPVSLIKVIRR